MENANPMISVIIPVYNVEKYLTTCLDSIINQSYKNYEIIIVNDGSKDNSLSIAEQYVDRFSRIKIINQENKGLSEARNAAYSFIKGKYTYFLDSDDFLLPETFENLVRMAEKNNLDLIKFDAKPFSDDNFNFYFSNYSSSHFLKESYIYTKNEYIEAVKKSFMPPVWLYFIKSEILLNNKIFFLKDILHEDELFTVQLLKYCHRIMYDSSQYFQRRYRFNSIMTGNIMKNEKSVKSRLLVVQKFQELIESDLEDKKYNEFVVLRQKSNLTTIICERNGKIFSYLKYLNKFNLSLDFHTVLRQMKKNVQSFYYHRREKKVMN